MASGLDSYMRFIVGGVHVEMELETSGFSNTWKLQPRYEMEESQFFAALGRIMSIFPSQHTRRENGCAYVCIGFSDCHVIRRGLETVEATWSGQSLGGLLQPTASLIAYFLGVLHDLCGVKCFRNFEGRKILWKAFDDETFRKCHPEYRAERELEVDFWECRNDYRPGMELPDWYLDAVDRLEEYKGSASEAEEAWQDDFDPIFSLDDDFDWGGPLERGLIDDSFDWSSAADELVLEEG